MTVSWAAGSRPDAAGRRRRLRLVTHVRLWRMHGLVPQDGLPLELDEQYAFTDLMRSCWKRADREIAVFERQIERYLREVR